MYDLVAQTETTDTAHWIESVGAEWGIGGSVFLVIVAVATKLLRAYGRHETQHQETQDKLKAVEEADGNMCREMAELRHSVERVADKVSDTNERVSRIEGRMNGHPPPAPTGPPPDFRGQPQRWV